MHLKEAAINQALETLTLKPDAPFPVFAGGAAAVNLKLCRRQPFLPQPDAFAAGPRPKPVLVQFCCSFLAPDCEDRLPCCFLPIRLNAEGGSDLNVW